MTGHPSAWERAGLLLHRARESFADLVARRRSMIRIDPDDMPLSLKRDLGLADGIFRFDRNLMRD